MKIIISALFAAVLVLVADAAAAHGHSKKLKKRTLQQLFNSPAAQRALKERNLQSIDDIGALAVDYAPCTCGNPEPCAPGFNTESLVDALRKSCVWW